MRIAILASGAGLTFEYLYQAYKNGDLQTNNDIVLLICNNPGAMVIERAKINGIPVEIINHKDYETREKFDTDVMNTLVKNNIDIVVMAGWMRIASPILVKVFKDKIINIHPSLLPSFKGADACKQAIKAGVYFSGCTAHIVNEEIDSGKILAQEVVNVYKNDTPESLHSRIKQYEGSILKKALILLIKELEYS